jgi:DNA gyrase/topoisomerase IV subunit B
METLPDFGCMKSNSNDRGKLKIGDDWNAIRIIALSQSNPLKAIAEFVENSIDAHANSITITRGREHGAHYLSIKDDGNGVPRDADGLPSSTSPPTSATRSSGA